MVDTTVREFLKRRAGAAAIAFISAACGLAIFVQLASWRDSFEPIAWKDQTLAGDRQEMADDLIARRFARCIGAI